MRFDIITCLPGLLDSPFSDSILQRAQNKGLLEVFVHDLREFGKGKHKQIDDYAYGGGAGMVLMADPIYTCIQKLKKEREYDEVIYMSPDGESFNQSLANELATMKNVLILAGHYKGVDERIRTEVITREISIGDYVLSGGELAAAVVVDSVGRLLPGVLNNETSALTDSFQDDLVAPPVYTRPSEWNGHKVPDVLLSGNEQAINDWRFDQAVERTKARRPGLLDERKK
jgi:tRNA (guanine37-N1)-methyltransferase